MSNILVAKELRGQFKAALSAASIAVDTDTAPAVPVTVLNRAPAGWVAPEKNLPALYVFNSGEAFHYANLSEVERTLFLEVVLMARSGADPDDQLDDMQLAVENMAIASGGFEIARSIRPVSVEIAQSQGAVIMGTRVIKFEIVFGVTPNDPSL